VPLWFNSTAIIRNKSEGFSPGVRIEYMDPIKYLRPARLALFMLLALPFALAFADDKATGEAPKPAFVDPYSITIDFPGGPLSKLLASLDARKDSPFGLSIIQSAGLDPILPAFSVRNVRIDAVFAALGRILEPEGYALNPVGPNLAVLARIHQVGSPGGFASFQLDIKLDISRPGETDATTQVQAIISAITDACEFADPGDPGKQASTLRFKYHPATKLLFVAGTHQQIDVALRVMDSLPNKK
jgi:hypothetical protein